jgi:enoyl-CoA hydratase/carnithine racemase
MMDAPVSEKPPAATLRLANVLYEKKEAIAYVTVNRPKVLNALNTPTWTDIRTAFEDARDDTAVHGVILTGAGNKAFIAGADIRSLAKPLRSMRSGRVVSGSRSSISSRTSASP